MSFLGSWLNMGVDSDGENFNIISGALKLGNNVVIAATRYIVSLANGSVYPKVAPDAAVVAKTASGYITATNFGKNITNTGASATIQLTLPAASGYTGKIFRIQITAAFAVQLVPQTGESIYLGGDGVASKYLDIAGVIGNYADIYCDGSSYFVVGYSGVLTKEA